MQSGSTHEQAPHDDANTSQSPCGHLQPLGKQCGAVTEVHVTDGALSPADFYRQFLKPSRPVIMRPRNAQHLLGSGTQHWGSFDYLAHEFGSCEVSVDINVKENRTTAGISMPLGDFLAHYKEKGWYMISEVPDKMALKLEVPKVIATAPYQGLMQDAVLWFNGERARYILCDICATWYPCRCGSKHHAVYMETVTLV